VKREVERRKRRAPTNNSKHTGSTNALITNNSNSDILQSDSPQLAASDAPQQPQQRSRPHTSVGTAAAGANTTNTINHSNSNSNTRPVTSASRRSVTAAGSVTPPVRITAGSPLTLEQAAQPFAKPQVCVCVCVHFTIQRASNSLQHSL
jgi:hypothetical protein